MPQTTSLATRGDRFREQLDRLAGGLDWAFSPAFSQAVEAFLTAMDYDDPALMRSHFNTAIEAFRDLIQEAVQKRLGKPRLVREFWQEISEDLKESPVESCDEFGRRFESALNTQLEALINLRDGPVRMLQARGHEIESASQLRSDIEELQRLKEGIFSNWPWSDQALPAVNRKMVAESRAAVARREGEGIEDLIRRLGGDPTKSR